MDETVFLVLYQYHSLIVQMLAIMAIFLLVVKLGQGYVKYQLKRMLWTLVTLGYVFMLSMIQIYNLYQGYIWVVCPLLCVRFNSFVNKNLHKVLPKAKALHKFIPNTSTASFVCALFITGVFAFFASGWISQFNHVACRQDELNFRVFEAKNCTLVPTFEPILIKINKSLPIFEIVKTRPRPLISHENALLAL